MDSQAQEKRDRQIERVLDLLEIVLDEMIGSIGESEDGEDGEGEAVKELEE